MNRESQGKNSPELLDLIPAQMSHPWIDGLGAVFAQPDGRLDQNLSGLSYKERESKVAEQPAGFFVSHVRGLRIHIETE